MSMAPTVVKPRPIQLLVDERVNNVRLLITKVVFEQEKTSYPAEMIRISDKKKRKKIRKICSDILEEIINDAVHGQQSQLLELTTEDTITYEVLGLPKTFGGKIRPNKRRKIKHQTNYMNHDEDIENMDEQSAAEYWNHLYQTNPEYYYQLYYTYYPEAAPNNNDTNMAHGAPDTSSSISSVPMMQCMNSGGDSGSNNNNNNAGNQSNTSTSNQSSGSSASNNNNTGSSGQSGGNGEDNNNNNNTLPNAHAAESMVDVDNERQEEKTEEKSPAEIMDRKYSLIEKIMKEMTDEEKSHKEVDIERMQLMMEEIKDADLDYEDTKERLAKAPAKIKDNGEFSIFSGQRVVFESEESDSEEETNKKESNKPIGGVVGEGVVEEGEHEVESSEDEDDDLPPLINTEKSVAAEEKKDEEEDSKSEEQAVDPAEAAYEEIKKELETVETKMNKAGKFSLFEGKHMVFSDESDDEGEEKQLDADMTRVNIEPEVVGEGEIYSDEEVNEDESEESEHEHEDMNVDVLPDPKPVELGKGHVKFDYGDSDSDSESEDNKRKSSAGDDSAVVGVGTVEMNDDLRFYDEDDSDYKMSEEEAEYDEEEEEGNIEEENVEVLKEAFTQQEEIDQQTEHRVDKSLMKYWNQRYSLFSKFDEGIQMDDEGWYSVTPEEIARHIAARMYQRLGPNATVIDAMVGVGGNTIQFASMFPLVFGIEMDPSRVLMAKNNAEVYGVGSNIEFVIGDYTCLAPHFRADAVFLSPPWGGPTYLQQEKFDITKMPLNGVDLFQLTKQVTPNIGYFLPRNTDASQLCQLADPGESCEIEQNYLYDKLKTITAYYGKLVWVEEESKADEAKDDEANNEKDENVK